MTHKLKTVIAYLLAAVILGVSTGVTVAYIYSQRYVQDSPTTATMGVFFKTTLNLEQYKNVSNGNGWLGNFDRYTRSDRHNDVITVYCKEWCKK